MIHLFEFPGLTEAVARSAASALIATVWESMLLVAGVGFLLKVVPRTTAAVRFAIWAVVFFASAVMPFAGSFLGTHHHAGTASSRGYLQMDPRWSYLIAGAWAVAVLARLAQLSAQGIKLRVLWMRADPVPLQVLDKTECLDMLRRQRVEVCTSEAVDRPSVIGFFAPRILVPTWLPAQLSAVELRHIVLHELEHLRRKDDWVNLLQKVGLVVFPLNPALFWVDRRLAAERELACDDGVLRATKMPRTYASCLASVAEMRMERRVHRHVVALALGVLGAAGMPRGRSEFSSRIESILGRRATVNPMMTAVVAVALVVSVLAASFGLTRLPQLVSFAPMSEAQVLAVKSKEVSATDVVYRGAAAPFQEATFHVPNSRPWSPLKLQSRSVPQRPKPRSEGANDNAAEAMPLRRADSAHSQRVSSGQADFLPFREVGSAPNQVAATPLLRQQIMVLTSSDGDPASEDAPAQLVVRMPDGGFYFVPIVYHAVVPVRDGWVIVQL